MLLLKIWKQSVIPLDCWQAPTTVSRIETSEADMCSLCKWSICFSGQFEKNV